MAVRVLIADDHQIVREGLCALLNKEDDLEVIGEAQDGRQAVEMAARLTPDVVILDVAMPDLNGIEAARQILAELPQARVMALSMHTDRRFVMEMLRAGASGYLLKDCAFEELARAIRTVATNQTYLSPGIAGVIVEDYVHHVPVERGAGAHALTAREREVLQLLAEGRTTKRIAQQLTVSVKTIETHRRQIMAKLGLDSVAELTKYAVREGLTSLD